MGEGGGGGGGGLASSAPHPLDHPLTLYFIDHINHRFLYWDALVYRLQLSVNIYDKIIFSLGPACVLEWFSECP